jgi:hypothetical protein
VGDYQRRIDELTTASPGIIALGGIWDQELLDDLYASCRIYIHGHSVGGTNPSLLRALGAGAPALAFESPFSRELLGNASHFFTTPDTFSANLLKVENDFSATVARAQDMKKCLPSRYSWDKVALDYIELARLLRLGAEPAQKRFTRSRLPMFRTKSSGLGKQVDAQIDDGKRD